MKLLQSFTKKDRPRLANSALSLVLLQIAETQSDLRKDALIALWDVVTPHVLPLVWPFAERESFPAFYIIKHMIQTPEDIARGVALARRYIAAEDYELRETSLLLLQKFSSMEREAERVFTAVQKYLDENFIDALKKAPPEVVLQPLKELRATIGKEYAEYGDLSSTIAELECKAGKERSI